MKALTLNALYAFAFFAFVAAAVAVVPGVEVKEKGATACDASGRNC